MPKDFIQNFGGHLDMTFLAAALQPGPKLWHLIERIVVPTRSDKHVRVKQIEHGLPDHWRGCEHAVNKAWPYAKDVCRFGPRDGAGPQRSLD